MIDPACGCGHFLLEATRTLARYLVEHGPDFDNNVLAVEQRIDFMIGPYLFGGIIDRIDLKSNLNEAADLILMDRKHLDNNPKQVNKKDIISLLEKIQYEN